MRSPELRAIFEQKMGEYWMTWVGAWIDWPVERGRAIETDTEIEALMASPRVRHESSRASPE
jgi:hypothetical protein